jgi:proline racemase
MFGAILLPPCDPSADIGLIFLDNRRFEPMCGHGVIGAITSLLETGVLPMREPVTEVRIDTAAGLVRAFASVAGNRVTSVSFENVPSFVYRRDLVLALPDVGRLTVDIAFGGNFFVLLDAEQLGLRITPASLARLADLGMRLLERVNEAVAVRHPELPGINRIIDLRFYERGENGADSRNVVILGDAMIDRSPCGTGTCAELALRFARGEIAVGQSWVAESVIGTRFTGEVVGTAQVGEGAERISGIVPRITGSAYLTGIHQFLAMPGDPIPEGFLLG